MLNPSISFELAAWQRSAPVELVGATLNTLLVTLTAFNVELLRTGRFPRLYSSGVVYREDPDGLELWSDAAFCIARGYGDCKKLSAWRGAELRLDGIAAEPLVKWAVMPDGQRRFHVLLRLPDGTEEDPSKLLGM